MSSCASLKYRASVINIMTNPWVGLGWMMLIIVSYIYIDLPLANYLYGINTSLYLLALWVTKLGLGSTNLIAATIVLLLSFLIRSPQLRAFAILLFIVIAATGVTCNVMKILVGRARPLQFFHHQMYGFYFFQLGSHMWSFPSGHATTISASMTALSLRWPRYQIVSLLVILLVCLSRLFLDQHYLSDVLAGILLGTWLTTFIYQQLCSSTRWGKYFQPTAITAARR